LDVTQRIDCDCRRFVTTYLSHLQGSSLTPLPWRMAQTACPETSLNNYKYMCCVTLQKSQDLICTAAETWNHFF
jgi:hypothetical protein